RLSRGLRSRRSFYFANESSHTVGRHRALGEPIIQPIIFHDETDFVLLWIVMTQTLHDSSIAFSALLRNDHPISRDLVTTDSAEPNSKCHVTFLSFFRD